MFATKKDKGNLYTKGIDFKQGVKTPVTKTVLDYLKKTFPSNFDFEEAKPKAPAKTKAPAKAKEPVKKAD